MHTKTLSITTPAVATGTSSEFEIGPAPFKGSVTAVTYVPNATITGANTNTRLVTVVNRAQDGSGSAVVATLQFNSGTTGTKATQVAVPLTGSVTGPDGKRVEVAAGDVLAFTSGAVGTGLADPGGELTVAFEAFDTIS